MTTSLLSGIPFRQMFEQFGAHAETGILIIDRKERIVYWNHFLEMEYEVPASLVIGRPLLETFPVIADEPVYGAIRKALDSARRSRLVNTTHQTLNRGRRLQNFSVVPLLGSDRQVKGVMVTVADVTKTASLEEEVRHSDKLATAGQLASGIAHEIGTPLGIISGTAELLMQDQAEDSPLREDLGVIFAEARRIRGLINQLLDYARAQKIAAEPLSIFGVLDRVFVLLRGELDRAGIELERVDDTSLPSVPADRDRLQQILINIIVNAIQAQPTGGKLRVSAHHRPMARQFGPRGAVEIQIMDWGPGISNEDASRAFDPFFTTKDPGQGTGMGLAVAKRLVEEHGGAISIERAAGAGAQVRVMLPVEKRSADS